MYDGEVMDDASRLNCYSPKPNTEERLLADVAVLAGTNMKTNGLRIMF